jgi:hypothetical protein
MLNVPSTLAGEVKRAAEGRGCPRDFDARGLREAEGAGFLRASSYCFDTLVF